MITISGSTPRSRVATLTSATTYLQKGQPYAVTVSLSQAVSAPVTIALSYGGTAAVQGPTTPSPPGTSWCRPGQTAVQVQIPTVTERRGRVGPGPDRRRWRRARAYQIGSPSSASVTITSPGAADADASRSALPTVTQGGAASFTITADQAPVKDTSVNFTVEGTAQPGQRLRAAGRGRRSSRRARQQVTVVLQSIQTNVEFEPTDMIVGAWPTRVGQVYVKAGATRGPG